MDKLCEHAGDPNKKISYRYALPLQIGVLCPLRELDSVHFTFLQFQPQGAWGAGAALQEVATSHRVPPGSTADRLH